MKLNTTTVEFIVQSLLSNSVPAIMGEPGIGKSSLAEAIASDLGTEVFILACNQLADKADLTGGRLVPTDDGKSYKQVFFPHQVISDAIAYANANPRETPVLLLDEINRTNTDVTSAALSLPTLRRIGSEKLPENLKLMVAGNDKGHVITLDDASLSRFVIIHLSPDAQTLLSVADLDLNEHIVAVLTEHPETIFEKTEAGQHLVDGDDDDDDDKNGQATALLADLNDLNEDMNQITTPRTIHACSRWLNAVDDTQLQSYLVTPAVSHDGRTTTLLNEFIEGFTGVTSFTTYLVAKISAHITSGNTAANTKVKKAPRKPSTWNDIKSATTVDELEEKLDDITDKERSAAFVFALYEPEDNSRIIDQLATRVPKLETDDVKMLTEVGLDSHLDKENVKAFVEGNSPLYQKYASILDMFA